VTPEGLFFVEINLQLSKGEVEEKGRGRKKGEGKGED